MCSIFTSWQQWIKDCGPLREPTSDWFKHLIGLKINYNFGRIVSYRLKSEFALLQTFSRLFHLVYFVKYLQMLLELNSTGLYQSSGKEKEICCLVFPSSTKREFNHFECSRATTTKKCTKSMMHVQSCCFANLNPFSLPFSLPSRRRCLSFLIFSWVSHQWIFHFSRTENEFTAFRPYNHLLSEKQ